MARRKGTSGKKHIDKEKERVLKELMEAMKTAIECGNEEDYIRLLKLTKPDLTREQLVSLVNDFRSLRSSRQP